jgi:anti-anti-sigma regulatory factor
MKASLELGGDGKFAALPMTFGVDLGISGWRRRDRSSGASALATRASKGAPLLGAPDESPAPKIHLRRSAQHLETLFVTIAGRIDRPDAARLADRLIDALAGSRPSIVICDVSGLVRPDAAAVDAICRMRVAARRLGARLLVRHASAEFLELLDLMGLCDVLADASGSGLQVWGQSEQREHPGRVEEERDPGDPITRQLEHLERPRFVPAIRGRLVLPERR